MTFSKWGFWPTIKDVVFYQHPVCMCFLWFSEPTAIISLYESYLLFFCNRKYACSLRGTNCTFIKVHCLNETPVSIHKPLKAD